MTINVNINMRFSIKMGMDNSYSVNNMAMVKETHIGIVSHEKGQ